MKKKDLNSKLNFAKQTVSRFVSLSLRGGSQNGTWHTNHTHHTSCDTAICTATFTCQPTEVDCGESQGPDLCEYTN